MPPKSSSNATGPSKKTADKAKQKIVEDKTFGLKNKKGKKQQTYIKNVAKQVTGDKKKTPATEQAAKLSKRELEKKKLDELNELFKPVQQAQKVAFGVDPKSVLCTYYKQGTCQKGNKCKFSHDLSLDRKSEKRSLYEDGRTEGTETMDDWDQKTLEEVVNKKHGDSNAVKTEIVCKFFLEAIDKSQYGWFWSCPNGSKCIYRHALPPGFVLKKDKTDAEDEENKLSLEELIENERNALTGDLTPVTFDTFMSWKKRKISEKKNKYEKDMKKKKEEFKAGKGMMKVSGKEVFMFKPELVDADDEEADDDMSLYELQQENDTDAYKEIDLEAFANSIETNGDDSNLTRVSTLSAKDRETAHAPTSLSAERQLDRTETPASDVLVDGVPVDESLFEDMEDLDLDE